MGYTINRREEGGHDLEGCMVREYQYIQRYMFLLPEKSTGGAWDVLCVCINDQCRHVCREIVGSGTTVSLRE